jgi:hypothetical protein
MTDGMKLLEETLEFSIVANIISDSGKQCWELVGGIEENCIPKGISSFDL